MSLHESHGVSDGHEVKCKPCWIITLPTDLSSFFKSFHFILQSAVSKGYGFCISSLILGFDGLFFGSHSWEYVITSHCGLNLHFLPD